MKLSSWLMLLTTSATLLARRSAASGEDGEVGEDPHYLYDQHLPPAGDYATTSSSRCCQQPEQNNLLLKLDMLTYGKHLFWVSTMDGNIHALDIERDGETVWQTALDGVPLMGGTLNKVQPFASSDDLFYLVPSLDGSLYMFSKEQRLLEPIPLNTEMLLHSVKIGNEAVAGGRSISTTGVDPNTGKIRYHCDSVMCEQNETGCPHSTLVFKRTSHAIRALDALNGREKWNLSVSEYDASLVVRGAAVTPPTIHGSNVRFLISPPKGIVSALSSCGQTLWTRSLGAHIAKAWQVEGNDLSEVSLFESNIHSLSEHGDPKPSLRPESLFYLGTNENGPFIMYSEKVRREVRNLARQNEYENIRTFGSGRDERALVSSRGGELSTFRVSEGTLDEVFARTFKRSLARQDELREAQKRVGGGAAVLMPATDEGREDPNNYACRHSDGLVLIGEENIRSAGYVEDENGDQGWFVVRHPTTRSKRAEFAGMLRNTGQCAVNYMRRSFLLEEQVTPLWKVFGIVWGILSSIFMGCMFIFFNRWKNAQRQRVPEVSDSPDVSSGPTTSTPLRKSASIETQVSSCPQLCPTDAPEDKPIPSPKGSPQGKEKSEDDSAARRRRNTSNMSCPDPFQSKFFTDFEPVKVLGRGGFGVVFEVKNKLDECPYAVKRIAVSNSEKAIERVLREVRAMAKLDHSGIIRYYHTWIERPPKGWQEEHDADMLEKIKSLKKLRALKVGREESVELPGKIDLSVDSFAPPPVEATSDDGSWLDESSARNGQPGPLSSESGSSSDDEDSENHKDAIIPMKNSSEHSDSIVFGSSSKNNTKPSSSSEVSKLHTDLVLVTSADEDLLPSTNTGSYVYLYIQMQLCADRTLFAWLSEHKKEEERELAKMKTWIKQLIGAVAYIHRQGLIHRDIKPQNVFFGSDGSLKIGDLGLVTRSGLGETETRGDRSSSSLSLHTDNVGTRGYMSPEQLSNQPYTFKVDVFSLGLIFTELVVPFKTIMERSKVLSDLQKGIQPEQLKSRDSEAIFVKWLTEMDPNNRPTCDDILINPFLVS